MEFKHNKTFPEQFKKIKIYPNLSTRKEIKIDSELSQVGSFTKRSQMVNLIFDTKKLNTVLSPSFCSSPFIVGINHFWLSGTYMQINHAHIFASISVKKPEQIYAKHYYYSELLWFLHDRPKYIHCNTTPEKFLQ